MKRLLFLVLVLSLAPMTVLAQAVDNGATTPVDAMSDYALYAVFLGFIGTYVAAAINRLHWPDYVRFGTFFAWSVLAAAGDAFFKRELDWHNWSHAFLFVLVAGIGFYNLNKGAVKAFEAATS